jgi:hypothetical protein
MSDTDEQPADEQPFDHGFYIEVTVAATVLGPDRKPMGDNMADVTLGFEAVMPAPPEPVDDEDIQRNLVAHMGPVIATLDVQMRSMGFAPHGEVDEPMTGHTSEIVGQVRTPDVLVQVGEPSMEVHD